MKTPFLTHDTLPKQHTNTNLPWLTKKNMLQLMACLVCIELLIYAWAVWTASFDKGNFFAIESEFIFDKCARNCARVSAAIILITLLMVGYYGLKAIYSDEKKKETFRVLLTLFTFNHFIHLLFIFLRFRSHEATLSIAANLHGFLTFISIVFITIIIWSYKKLDNTLYLSFCIYSTSVFSLIKLFSVK